MSDAAVIELVPALIVEDMPATRSYLESLLRDVCGNQADGDTVDIVTVGTLADAHAFLESTPRAFVLVDIGLPDGNGVDLVSWISERYPHTVSVIVSAWGDETTVLAALRAGATGYIFKESDTSEMRAALQSVQRGGAPIDPFVARHILALLSPDPVLPGPRPGGPSDQCPLDQLSSREKEILQLVSKGLSNREIAESTGLSRFTIEGYTKTIYRKLAVNSRTAAVFEAKARGILR